MFRAFGFDNRSVGAGASDFQAVRSVPVFRYLSDAEIQKLLTVAKRRHFEAGEELIAENSLGTETFILIRGTAQLVKGGLRLRMLTAGSCFGEMAMFENAPRSASIWSQEEGELLSITRSDLFPLLQRDPKLAVKLLWAVCQMLNGRLRKTTEDLMQAKSK